MPASTFYIDKEISVTNGAKLWFESTEDILSARKIIEIISAVIAIFGCIGNIFIILIISKWDSLTSGATFMLLLAIFDFFSASFMSTFSLILPFIGFNLRDVNNFWCAFTTFSTFAIYSSYYITVLFSVDKFIAVMFPYKYREFGKPKISLLATALVVLTQMAWAIPSTMVFRIDSKFRTCGAVYFDIVAADYIIIAYPLINFVINGVFPVFFVFMFTFGTIIKLRIQSKKRDSTRVHSLAGRRDSEMTRQMIVVCFAFGILCLVVTTCVQIMYTIYPEDAYDHASMYFLFAITMCSNSLINSANFYVYIIFGRKFRANFLALFCIRTPNN
ncbi:uncharacterized protein LOC142341257 [Convolutriloba macropyga]|uniref:uncharacterized protein LOC142341257 n=1 Tax=Convolutriloba macropyga TaxID=536237 RepID=UPI003F526FA3